MRVLLQLARCFVFYITKHQVHFPVHHPHERSLVAHAPQKNAGISKLLQLDRCPRRLHIPLSRHITVVTTFF